jgi:tetrapyrrole methylase family protein/MazG family protein
VRSSLIEETYEVVEALDTENPTLLREELGDLLFQVMFHAQIEVEEGRFGIDGVVDDICKKMIHRHPHVFGTVAVENSADVLKNWEAIKTEEKQRNTLVEKLRAIPPMMPALMRATKVAKKTDAANSPSSQALIVSLEEQIAILNAQENVSDEEMQKYIGALLMSTCRLCGQLGVDAELALSRETDLLIEKTAENCK